MKRLFTSPIFWGLVTALAVCGVITDPSMLKSKETVFLLILLGAGWTWFYLSHKKPSCQIPQEEVPERWRPDPDEDPVLSDFYGNFRWNIIRGAHAFELERYVVVAIKTTSFGKDGRIIQIAADKYENGSKIDAFHTFVYPGVPVPEDVIKYNGITDKMLRRAPIFKNVATQFLDFIDGYTLVVHKDDYACSFLNRELTACGYAATVDVVDTKKLTIRAFPKIESHMLRDLVGPLKIGKKSDQRNAADDAFLTELIYQKCRAKLYKPT